MTDPRRAAAGWAVSVMALAATVAVEGAAHAQDGDAENSYTVTEYAYRRLEKAQKALEEKRFKAALSALDELAKRSSLSAYERALMYQTRSYVHVQQEQLPQAADAMTKALAENALPEQAALSTQFNLGQIYLADEKPKQAARVLQDWSNRVEDPSPDALYTVAVAFAQAENNAGALRYVDQALRKKKGQAPKSWLQLKLAVQVKLQQWKGAIDTLATLVEREPTDVQLWKQLSALYAQSKQPQESVATLELAFRLDLLKEESDIKLLAQNMVAAGVPLKAASIVEKSLDKGWLPRSGENLELLATAYVNAAERDRALEPLAAAARETGKAKLWEELGRIHLALENWKASEAALSRALSIGGLRQPGQTYIMLGMARHRLNQIAGAREAFQEALKFKSSAATARSWLSFISSDS